MHAHLEKMNMVVDLGLIYKKRKIVLEGVWDVEATDPQVYEYVYDGIFRESNVKPPRA